jgi:hypothetical protein
MTLSLLLHITFVTALREEYSLEVKSDLTVRFRLLCTYGNKNNKSFEHTYLENKFIQFCNCLE